MTPEVGTHPAIAPEHLDVIEGYKQRWRAGEAPDALAALGEHPELLAYRSLVVDLAYEEYCLREEAGDTPNTDSFCARLPVFASEVREVIHGHRLLADHPNVFEAPAPPRWPSPGDQIEGLTVVRELGRGAFARVYLALDPATGGRRVALKLSPASSTEAQTLGPISHPNVVSVYWAGPVGGMHAICMPYVGATTLANAIEASVRPSARRPTTATILQTIDRHGDTAPGGGTARPCITGRESYVDGIVSVFIRIADALLFLHRLGTSHGDLKPSNVILGPHANPYLIDFNLARTGDAAIYRFGGTLPYMAPERIRILTGQSAGQDDGAATDVYSFGAVLFEALTGHVPYAPRESADPKAIATDLLDRQFTTGFAFDASVRLPAEIVRLVRSCLAVTPGARPKMAEVKRRLERFRQRKRRTGRRVVAALVLVAAAAAAIGLPLDPRGPSTVAVAVQPFDQGVALLKAGQPRPALVAFQAAFRAEPDGRTAAFMAYCYSLLASHDSAAEYYRQAVEEFQYDQAWVRNNRAFSLYRRGGASAEEAIREATAALQHDPELVSARCIRALARCRRQLRPKAVWQPDEKAMEDIRFVMARWTRSAALNQHTGTVLAIAGSGNEKVTQEAVALLREAVERGASGANLASNAALKDNLGHRKDFQEAVSARVIKADPVSAIDPCQIDPTTILTDLTAGD